jgi:hypothetical protein
VALSCFALVRVSRLFRRQAGADWPVHPVMQTDADVVRSRISSPEKTRRPRIDEMIDERLSERYLILYPIPERLGPPGMERCALFSNGADERHTSQDYSFVETQSPLRDSLRDRRGTHD